jgi:hypothetical protein
MEETSQGGEVLQKKWVIGRSPIKEEGKNV